MNEFHPSKIEKRQSKAIQKYQTKKGLEKRNNHWRFTGEELNGNIDMGNLGNDWRRVAVAVQARLRQTLCGEHGFQAGLSEETARKIIGTKQDILKEILDFNIPSYYLDGATLTALFDANGDKLIQHWGYIPDFSKNPIINWQNREWLQFLKAQGIELESSGKHKFWTQRNELAKFLVEDLDELDIENPFVKVYLNSAELTPIMLFR